MAPQSYFHVIVLSNFARGYDKYANTYAKVPESTYLDRFHLLARDELAIGVRKAGGLLARLAIPGDRLLVLETRVGPGQLGCNPVTGLGHVLASDRIRLTAIHELETYAGPDRDPESDLSSPDSVLRATTVEDAMAASLLLRPELQPYAALRPRAVSFLPVASACQARCSFCFSAASISADQPPARPDWDAVTAWLDRAVEAGAERAVITGGGEPTLLPRGDLERLVATCSARLPKVVLITNAHTLTSGSDADRVRRLDDLARAGLGVLAVSRHHHRDDTNAELMGLETPVTDLLDTWHRHRGRWPELKVRLICVLQRGGVEDEASLADYLSWAVAHGVEEVCLKELYVSTSTESVYFDRTANQWSRTHQIPLALVTGFAERHGLRVDHRLPWGAPVRVGEWNGRPVRIAAYTEPSLLWERSSGLARSWNVMADGRCYASLEDRASEIDPPPELSARVLTPLAAPALVRDDLRPAR